MISTRKADTSDAQALSAIAAQTFMESHGHSADPADINTFIADKYTVETCLADLANPANNYHFIYYNDKLAGFSNIIFNFPCINSDLEPVTKLERIYILKEFYDHKLGHHLFNLDIELAKSNGQKGIWLFVWKENERAIRFYAKNDFNPVGSFDYRISPTHTNPNHVMLLEF